MASVGRQSALIITWREEGGPVIEPSGIEQGTGMVIVDRMIATARGTIERTWRRDGLNATIRVPFEKGG